MYVFDVCGNHRYHETNFADMEHFDDFNTHPAWHDGETMLYVYAPMNQEQFERWGEHAHFHVKSFRYYANDQAKPARWFPDSRLWHGGYQAVYERGGLRLPRRVCR